MGGRELLPNPHPRALALSEAATRLTAVSDARRLFDHHEFHACALAEAKDGARVTVCLPAKNEAATVGDIVGLVRRHLVERVPLVDEILVVDDRSVDDTASAARSEGARVVRTGEVLAELGAGTGKGEALWKGLAVATGDIIVWCDADITNFGPRFVVGLLGPLLTDPTVAFVKGFYDRPVDGKPGTGGRTTELVVRPVIATLFPHLSGIVQPLSGEYAGRRTVLEEVPFVQDYGVDLGLLIDISERFGLDAIAQTDLGARVHRNRNLDQLSPQALAILQTAFAKAKLDTPGTLEATLLRPGLEPLVVTHVERPPLATVELPPRDT
jgi:glucosyl-3-phosphoglycerate synthase